MAKRFKSGKCAHCLTFHQKLTSDHVFPKSWYPDTTPPNMEKWQMPSCSKCNKEFGAIENDLIIKFGLCVDPSDFNSLGLAEKALRALNPLYAKDEKDRKARLKKREQIKKEMFIYDAAYSESILPGFGIDNYPNQQKHYAIGIKPEDLIKVCQKIIRGTQYALWNKFVTRDLKIEVFFIPETKSKQFSEMVDKYGVSYHRGPGIKLGIAVAHDDPEQVMYEIIIWDRFKYYGMIVQNE